MKILGCYLWLVVTVFVFSGCEVNSGIIKIEEDTYKIHKQAATGLTGGTAVRESILLEANEFCVSQGKVLKTLQMGGSHPPYILGNFAKATLHFMCLDSDDPRLKEYVDERLTPLLDKTVPDVRTKDDVEAKMKTLNKLLVDGLITQSDFEEQKGKLLNDYTNK